MTLHTAFQKRKPELSNDFNLLFNVDSSAVEKDFNENKTELLSFLRKSLSNYKIMLKAEVVIDLSADTVPKVTQAWIRRVHEEVTSAQDTHRVWTPVGWQDQPLPKGEYKNSPNHVETASGLIHAYAPVDQTSSEMTRLVDELESETFSSAHPSGRTRFTTSSIRIASFSLRFRLL